MSKRNTTEANSYGYYMPGSVLSALPSKTLWDKSFYSHFKDDKSEIEVK